MQGSHAGMGEQTMSFGIDCQWIKAEGTNVEDATLCRLAVNADRQLLTQNVSIESGDICDSVVVSAWPLAVWLGWNWWRLLYETGPVQKFGQHSNPSVDWERAHYLPSADYGYQWPHIRFVSDEKFIYVHLTPDSNGYVRVARYNGNVGPILVTCDDFAKGIMDFLNKVDSRLEDQFAKDDLRGLLKQLSEEIEDKELAEYRKIEAMTGYDPDEAPTAIIEWGRSLIHKYGETFFNSVASSINRSYNGYGRPAERLEKIANAAKEVGIYGIKGKFVLGNEVSPMHSTSLAPWTCGRALARHVRQQIGLAPDKILESSLLRAWFEIDKKTLKNGQSCGESGICHKNGDSLKFRFADEGATHYTRNRRFFLARLAGACLDGKFDADLWLAIGPGATWSQKMQRAFAAELLAPIEVVSNMLPNSPTPGSVQKIADHFATTPYTIAHSLANNKVISREMAERLAA